MYYTNDMAGQVIRRDEYDGLSGGDPLSGIPAKASAENVGRSRPV